MALSRRKLSAEKVLAQLQDILSDESGDEKAEPSEDEAVPSADEDSSSTDASSESDDDEVMPLRKRVTIQQDIRG